MADFGTLSYGFASITFLMLTGLLAVGWEGSSHGARLIAACAVTSAWGVALAGSTADRAIPLSAVPFMEALRGGAWAFVLTGCVGVGLAPAVRDRVQSACAIVVVGLGAWFVASPWLVETPAQVLQDGNWPFAGAMLAALLLALLGYVYHRTRERYSLRHLALALGLAFGYDLFANLYALMSDTGVASTPWLARGFVTGAMLPLVAVAAKRNPEWHLRVFVSRQATFSALLLLLVSVTLLAALAGASLLLSGGHPWLAAVGIAILLAGGGLLALLTTSAPARQRTRVFIARHFYQYKYDYRSEWLRFVQTLSRGGIQHVGPAEARPVADDVVADPYTRAIRATAQIIASPAGVLFLRQGSEDGPFAPVAAWPVDPSGQYRTLGTLPADDPMLRLMRDRQWVLDLEEYRRDPAVYDDVALPDTLTMFPEARIVMPLLEGAELIGLVVLANPSAPFQPNFEDRDLLKTVGQHVATHIAQHEADRQLAEHRQFAAYHRLTAFVMHDLKNLAAQLALIVTNAERHRRNPEFVDDAISTVANAARRMERLIVQLHMREEQGAVRRNPIVQLARLAVQRSSMQRPVPELQVSDEATVLVDADRFVAAVEHLLRNAQEATPPDGTVRLRVDTVGRDVRLTLTDSGSGMSREFIEKRLFTPFDSTKGSKGMGIGAYQAREYVRAVGGVISVQSTPGRGTTFEIRLPIAGE